MGDFTPFRQSVAHQRGRAHFNLPYLLIPASVQPLATQRRARAYSCSSFFIHLCFIPSPMHPMRRSVVLDCNHAFSPPDSMAYRIKAHIPFRQATRYPASSHAQTPGSNTPTAAHAALAMIALFAVIRICNGKHLLASSKRASYERAVTGY